MNNFQAQRCAAIFQACRQSRVLNLDDANVVRNFTEVAFNEVFGDVSITSDGPRLVITLPAQWWTRITTRSGVDFSQQSPLADVIKNAITGEEVSLAALSEGVSFSSLPELAHESALFVMTVLLLRTINDTLDVPVGSQFTPLQAAVMATDLSGGSLVPRSSNSMAELLNVMIRNQAYAVAYDDVPFCPLADIAVPESTLEMTLHTLLNRVQGTIASRLIEGHAVDGYQRAVITDSDLRSQVHFIIDAIHATEMNAMGINDVTAINDLLSACHTELTVNKNMTPREIVDATIPAVQKYVQTVAKALNLRADQWYDAQSPDTSRQRLQSLISSDKPTAGSDAPTALLCHITGAIGGFIAGRQSTADVEKNHQKEEDIWKRLRQNG